MILLLGTELTVAGKEIVTDWPGAIVPKLPLNDCNDVFTATRPLYEAGVIDTGPT